MGRAGAGAGAPLIRTGLLGGSFNPAHRAHRGISLAAMEQLGLDEMWWLVSPGNPLKTGARDMAPLPARLAFAKRVARRSRIRATDIEAQLDTRYTVDTVRALIRRYPNRRFVWVMGADIVAEMHRWRDWRRLARSIVIAVAVRPGYAGMAEASPAAAWLRRFVRTAGGKDWTRWRPPALVLLHLPPDSISATALRRADPDWYARVSIPISPQPPR
jgi:nicotinate-nucleotide adenylyltransferase